MKNAEISTFFIGKTQRDFDFRMKNVGEKKTGESRVVSLPLYQVFRIKDYIRTAG